MSSTVSSNPPPVPAESKSARKKKSKAETAAQAVGKTATKPIPVRGDSNESPAPDGKVNGDASMENNYIRELQKNIRNVNKKLNAMQKVDAIIAENPDLSLDDLVATKKINADQKAQALKKPKLKEQLAQLEDQIAQYKEFDKQYQTRFASEKEALQSAHSEELEKLRKTLKAEAVAESKKEFGSRLLTLSRFLRAAAARRQREEDESDEAKAFEGALLLVYSGDITAVNAAENLIDGTEEKVLSVEGTPLDVTFAQVKQLSLEEAPVPEEEVAEEAAPVDQTAASGEDTLVISTDPTVANAGLTEIDDTNNTTRVLNGEGEELEPSSAAPAATSVEDGAANAAAASQWDNTANTESNSMEESYEMIPRDPTETETPHVPAGAGSTESWADQAHAEHAAATPPTTTAAAANGSDGFHEVHHGRGRGRGSFQGEGRGGFRGRGGPRGGGRGRGFRGDGRGRGGFRGRGRGGFQGGEGATPQQS